MDNDSSMLSTPTSEADVDTTFDHDSPQPHSQTQQHPIPARTPRNNHLNAAVPGELSPPRSNGPSIAQANTSAHRDTQRANLNNDAGLGEEEDEDEDADAEFDDVDDEGLDMRDSAAHAAGYTTAASTSANASAADGLARTNRTQAMQGVKGGQGGNGDDWRPAVGWKNKKAQEEMSRAWEFIVDKGFDVGEYGDPLA